MKNRTVVAYMGAALLSVSAGFASAAEPGDWSYGFYAGAYLPDSDLLDTGATGGVRLGYLASERVALSAQLGYTELDGDDGSGPDEIKGDIEAILLDFNLWYIFRPESRVSLLVGAGPGWAWVDGSVKNGQLSVDRGHLTDDSITANVAFGPLFKLNDRVDIRLMTRLRYYDHRDNDDLDKEITLGIVMPLTF